MDDSSSTQNALSGERITPSAKIRGRLEPRSLEDRLATFRSYSTKRRARLRALGICINGQFPATELTNRVAPKRPLVEHGPPVTRGGKCQRCVDVHAKKANR